MFKYPRTDTTTGLFHQIGHLLLWNHTPLVKSGPSKIAGNGVFALVTIPENQVIALYPGVFTPPNPISSRANMPLEDCFSPVQELYLANKTSPAGIAVEDNAYILNLSRPGGYLDGACLSSPPDGRKLDLNPSACGHLINHSAISANVEYESFSWDMVLATLADHDNNYLSRIKDDACLHDLPNANRQDGSAWYADQDQVVRFPNPDELCSSIRTNHSQEHRFFLGGAAFITTRTVDQGEEILLNYRLRKPYPAWARDWYTD